MATFHTQLLQAVAATLQSLASVPAARVYVELESPLEREDCPAISITPGDARSESFGSDGTWDILKVRLQFTLGVITRGDPQTALADPVIAEANAALMADPSLGGLAQRLAFSGSRPRRANADGTAGSYDLMYEVTVLVNERTLQIWSQ
jgi:hypothetical protein